METSESLVTSQRSSMGALVVLRDLWFTSPHRCHPLCWPWTKQGPKSKPSRDGPPPRGTTPTDMPPHWCATPPTDMPPWCMAMTAAKYLGLWGQISSCIFLVLQLPRFTLACLNVCFSSKSAMSLLLCLGRGNSTNALRFEGINRIGPLIIAITFVRNSAICRILSADTGLNLERKRQFHFSFGSTLDWLSPSWSVCCKV